MRNYYRKSAPRVKNGIVQLKNRWEKTPNIYNTEYNRPLIDKERPGEGYKHLLRKKEVEAFLELLPEWDKLPIGLNAILLASGEYDAMGWHQPGIVAICAWDREIYWEKAYKVFYEDHRDILDKLSVPCKANGKYYKVEFTLESAKAFQLVHILVHELGHHHDRMTTKSKHSSARGESFAEKYANNHENEILAIYCEKFNYIYIPR